MRYILHRDALMIVAIVDRISEIPPSQIHNGSPIKQKNEDQE